MGLTYLWDTNTVIYYLQQQLPPGAEKFIDSTLTESPPAISVITEMELLCWKTSTEKDLEVLNNFISETFVIELDREIKLKTAELRKAYRIKLPDAIIAATALVNKQILISRNISDFKEINGLSVVNPWEM